MNTYLLVFNPIDEGREAVTEFLDRLPAVIDWHASMNNAVVLVSDADTTLLAERVRDRFPGVRFVIAPLDADAANGILPRATWNFLSAAKVHGATSPVPDRKPVAAESSLG